MLGYYVRCIKRSGTSSELIDSKTLNSTTEAYNYERLVLELQPAERSIQSKEVEADLVLWTIGSKPLLPQLEPDNKPVNLPLNGRGQVETDETLRVKGHTRIFAVGDSSAVRDSRGKLLPSTAQVLVNPFISYSSGKYGILPL